MFANGAIVEEGTHDTLLAQEGSKYQEMIRAQMIGGHENDDADQDRNNIPINDKDNEQDAGTRTNAVLLFIICCFCSITVESTSLLKKVQSISADQVRDRSPL